MKATIEFDDLLYRRLKIEAARRGLTVREMVADGVRRVLDSPEISPDPSAAVPELAEWRPAWFGSLHAQARRVDDHSMSAVRASIEQNRGR